VFQCDVTASVGGGEEHRQDKLIGLSRKRGRRETGKELEGKQVIAKRKMILAAG
jgi:hypothetical protein